MAIPDTVSRILSAQVAVRVNPPSSVGSGPGSLEDLIRQLHGYFTTVDKRQVASGEQIIECRHYKETKADGVFLHLAAHTPGDTAPIVPRVTGQANGDLGATSAPQNTEFLDGDLMVHIVGDHVGLCRVRLSPTGLVAYVQTLGQKMGLTPQAVFFSLKKRSDMDKLELVRREGVHEVRLGVAARDFNIDDLEQVIRTEQRTPIHRIGHEFWREVSAVLGIEPSTLPTDAENVMAEIVLKFDKRKAGELDRQILQKLGDTMVNGEDEGFSIKTLGGSIVRAGELALSKRVALRRQSKSVSYDNAWEELLAFYKDLTAPSKD